MTTEPVRLSRLDGWEDRLLDVLARHAAAPYEPGRTDCFVMACEAVEALTGVRPWAAVSYSTDAGAARQMRRHGFERLSEAMLAVGLVERPAAMARRGDIAALATAEGRETLGVVIDGGDVLAREAGGVRRVPVGSALRVLGVG